MRPWRYLIAACGLLAIAPSQAQQPVGPAGKGPAVEESQPKKPNKAERAAQRDPAPVVIVETPQQAAHAEERERKADQHEADDLKAQRDAADSAQRAAASAERQEISAIALSLTGTVVALVAVVMSILTSRRSDRAAQTQLRAYLQTSRVGSTFAFQLPDAPPIELWIEVWFKNTGQTPVRMARTVKDHKWIEADTAGTSAGFDVREKLSKAPTTGVGVGVEISTKPIKITIADLLANTAARRVLLIYALVTYEDVFGKKRETEICYSLDSFMVPPNQAGAALAKIGPYQHQNRET